MGWRSLLAALGWLTMLSAVHAAGTLPQQRLDAPAGVRIVGVHPVISNVTTTGVAATAATITWKTDKPSDSQVEYGATKLFGSTTPLNTNPVTSHSVTIAGLAGSTLYHFRVYSRDSAGNLAVSRRYTLTTAAPSGLTIVLSPEDTSLNLDATNRSTAPTLTTYTWPNQRVANAIVMKFNLSSLPAGVTVHDATLTLGLVDSDTTPDATYAVSAHKIVGRNPVIAAATGFTADGTAQWTANTCCNNNVPMAQADISAPYDIRAVDKTSGPKSWTIAAMVQEWVSNPATNFGLLMNSDASTPADRYRYFASMEHADAARRPSLRVSYSLPAPDTTLPSASMSAPAAGAVVSGTIAVTAAASDNVGVTSVQFLLDGVNLGSADTSAPYSVNWDTTSATNASHTLQAVARDAAGNQRTSSSVTVTVANVVPPPPPPPDTTLPSASMSAPAAGAVVSGTVTVTAAASDNVGVTSVQFQLDGANLGTADTTAPYSIAWDTTATTNALHTLRAVARDAAGNQQASPGITVTVLNVAPPPPSNPWTNEPSGFTVIEETGWELGTLGNWYKIFTSADKPISVSTITGSLLGESRALQIDFPQGHTGGGGTELRFDIPSASRSNEVYVGFYAQVNSQWQGHSSGINKLLYLHDGGSSFAAMWYEMFGSGSAALDLYVVNQSGSGPAGFHENVNEITFTRGQWHKVEIYQKQGDANNGIVRVWVNGILAIDRSDVDTRSTPIDNVTISGIWGGVGDSKNQADFMRFDRIRISRR